MAKKVKITKGGQTVYPATVMDAVVHPDLRVDASKLIEEVNVSKIYPTGGIDGTNKYTLETAIAMIPASLRSVGIKCSFLNEAGEVETWEFGVGTFTETGSWRQIGAKKLEEFATKKNLIPLMEFGNTQNINFIDTIKKGDYGELIPIFIERGVTYNFYYKSNGGDAGTDTGINVHFVTRDGSYELVDSFRVLYEGVREVSKVYEKDYYGIILQYSSVASATFMNISVSRAKKSDWVPDPLGKQPNIYPDPFMEAGDNLRDLDGISSLIIQGTPQYNNGYYTIPVGAFLGVVLDLTKLPYSPNTDKLNAYIKAKGNGFNLNIGFKVSGSTFTDLTKVVKNEFYNGWYSAVGISGKQSTDNTMRVAFDNRNGTEDLVVEQCLLFTGDEEMPVGLFSKIAWDAWNKVKDVDLTTLVTNHAPYYTDYTIKGPVKIVAKKESLEILAGQTGIVYGYEFYISDFCSEGDTISIGVDVLENSGIESFFMNALFYEEDGGEIGGSASRISIRIRDGVIGLLTASKSVPAGTKRILVRFQGTVNEGGVLKFGDNYLIKGSLDNPPYNFLRQPVIGGEASTEATKSIVYVDPTDGNDDNTGESEKNAYRTFDKALKSTGRDATIILAGDISEAFNISTGSKHSIRLIGKQGYVNRIIMGTKITGASLVSDSDRVYEANVETFPTGSDFRIFQHEVPDETTLIPEGERHPLQRGKTYRLDSSKIVRAESLDSVKSSDTLCYYYDTSAKKLYFKIKEGTTLSENPVYIPTNTPAIFNNNGRVDLEIANIEVWYSGGFSLSSCHNAHIIDCAAKFTYGGGGMYWNNSIGMALVRCESAGTFSGTSTGDGFNAHSNTSGDARSKHTTATLIDCWSHDNNDDGYSDHERCETTIMGGLFEYNDKGGLTPSYGAQDSFYNVYCRKQIKDGITLTGGATEAEGGKGSQVVAYNCVCENNSVYNFSVKGEVGKDVNTMILVNCISINGGIAGYYANDNTKLVLKNCTDKGSSEVKVGTNVQIDNGQLVV